MYKNINEIRKHVLDNNAQSHLCICNTDLYEDSILNGIYGFPHQGSSKTKSFWRAVASMYNIGPHDLIFIYRTNGAAAGCKEIHGPFKIKSLVGIPALYYDPASVDYPMNIPGESGADCKVRFLYEKAFDICRSLSDNYELIKKFESKEIWGYRHPSVMNIGAARKKSVTSFTSKQTLLLLDLLERFGKDRQKIENSIPTDEHLEYYTSLSNKKSFKLDDAFLTSSSTNDEAFLYAYILRGLKTRNSVISNLLIQNFTDINSTLIDIPFDQISVNAMLEVIISPHLQDELDIVLMDKNDSRMLFMELKEGVIDQSALNQAVRYLDLLSAVFPERKVYANVIGSGKDPFAEIPSGFSDRICVISFNKIRNGHIEFQKV